MTDTPRGKGRPSKFTPEIRKALIDTITAGLTYTHACQIVGIDYDTFNKWRLKGNRETKGDFFDFVGELTLAETQTALSMMATVRKCAQGYKIKRKFVNKNGDLITYDEDIPSDWRASTWWLEHRYPEEYGKQRIEHTGKDGGPVAMTFKVEWTDSTEGDNSGHST